VKPQPLHRRTGADLRAALADVPPPDDEFVRHVAEAVALLDSEVRDPWAGASSGESPPA
jgi:hypothetical protein